MKSYQKYSQWVLCPECSSEEVSVWATYDGEIGFSCKDCEKRTDPSFGTHVYKKSDE